jgi:spore coat protein A, manganese oxidase
MLTARKSLRNRQRAAAFRYAMESLEERVMMAAAPPLLQPPAGLTLMNAATVPMFVNDITAINPFVAGFHYTADNAAGNHFTVGAYPITQDLGLGTNPATGLPYQTPLFGYGPDAASATYPGRTFEVQSGAPIAVTWVDGLPAQHVAQIDPTLLDVGMAGMGISYDPLTNSISGGIPFVTHLHGGHTDAVFDGTPEQWWNAGGAMGMDYYDTQVTNPTQPVNTFTYRNDQQSATLWYHDHAMGVTRLNAYAGMAGFYLVRDAYDTGLANNPLGLPAGAYEMGLAIQDKQFLSDGEIWFAANAQSYTDPVSGHTGTVASTLPEEFGDVVLVNGKAWPKMNVEAKRYRFRIINGSDSRFYTMMLSNANNLGTSAMPIWQIGTDQGLLNNPVKMATLTIAPGERVDFVLDFSKFKPGTRFVMTNSAPAPFPGGAKVTAGTTDRIMAFDVVAATGPDTSLPMSTATNLRPANPIPAPTIVAPTRALTLYETTDALGRITPLMGTPTSSAEFMDPITENIAYDPVNGTTEVWQIFNTTADTHPIHLHQVGFQVLTRQSFSTKLVNLGLSATGVTMWGMSKTKLLGTPVLAAGNEVAWKDTIQLNPGEVITVRAKFDLPGKYVTHCHILSHEEHDMMRYMQIGPDPFPTPAYVVDASGTVVTPVAVAAPLAMTSPSLTPTPSTSATVAPMTSSVSASTGNPAPRPATHSASHGSAADPGIDLLADLHQEILGSISEGMLG